MRRNVVTPLITCQWSMATSTVLFMPATHKGRCYCGAVEIEASGQPLDMGYCHCENCRRYSTAPVSAFTVWKSDSVRVPKGRQFLGTFKSSDISDRSAADTS
jgi:hypothetical protein